MLARFDAFVVGSDQVWKPNSLSDMPTNFHGFLDDGDARARFSYAASFGTDTPAFDTESLPVIRSLAERFDGMSVREASGIDVCRDVLGRGAAVHVDPTLLVDAQVYRDLGAQGATVGGSFRVASYVLDDSDAKASILNRVRTAFGNSCVDLVRPARIGVATYRDNKSSYHPFTVEQWLYLMNDAEFVVTDSFHGTVFALIFNKPFVAIVNRERGAARFESLLDMFDLRERLIEPGSAVPEHLLVDSVDWERVNARIAAERLLSFDYLSTIRGIARERAAGRAEYGRTGRALQ